MQELRANTQVKVKIGPVVAVGDGFTPVTTLSLSTADEAELFKHDASAVTDISGATFAAITSADGYYNLTLTTSLTDTEGLMDVVINDDSLCLPVKATFMVLSEAAWDSKYVAKDDGFMDVNIKTVGRADTQETEANNLEAACAAYSATRGLTGTAVPAAAADAAGGLLTASNIAKYQGAIWFKSSAANTDTEFAIGDCDGTPNNPVSSMAAVMTLLTSSGFDTVRVMSGSTATLAATFANKRMIGDDWTLALGTQDISNSHFEGATSVTGTGTGTTPSFHHCDFGAATLPPCTVWDSCLSSTITLGTVGSLSVWKFMGCHAGGSTLSATLNMNGQEAAVAFAGWSGTLTIDNSTHNNGSFAVYGTGSLVENASCTSALATLEVAGSVRLTKNGSGILTDSSRWGENQSITNVTGTVAELGTQAKADVNAEADTALTDAGVTTTRTGYLDKLNISGNVASSAEATAIQNNTRVVRSVPVVIERPDSGTQTYRIEVLLYDSVGNMEVPDSAPTIELVDQGGTDLSARLDSATMALVDTGRYRAVYTASTTDDLEQLKWTFTVVEGGVSRKYGNDTIIVDTTAVDFTAADRTKLEAVHAKLPSKTYLTGTTNADGDVQMDEATGNFPGTVAGIAGTITTLDALDTAQDAQHATTQTAVDAVPTATEIDTQLTSSHGAGAWTSGGSSSSPELLQSTTIATLASQTSFTLTAGSADNDVYNDCLAIFTDQATSTQKAVAVISDYVGSTRTVTLKAAPGFTIAVGDTVNIVVGTTAALVWANTDRTLTVYPVADEADTTTDISVVRGNTIVIPISGLGSLVGRSKLWFTVKRVTLDKTDAQATIQVIEGTGLVCLNAVTTGLTAADASLVVTDEAAGNITVTIKPSAADDLDEFENGFYDVQVTIATVITTPRSGSFEVTADVTRSIA